MQHKPAQTSDNAKLPPPPSAADAANLARAMGGGAAGIMPEDAPKDKYGKPYIIGDLGGVPVNLPPSVVEYVEYNDSPGFNPQALREFKPPVRTYDSVLKAFGFQFRNHDLTLYDRRNSLLYHARKEDREKRNGGDWIDVGISAGNSYGKNPDALTDYLKDAIDPAHLNPPYDFPYLYHERLPEDMYGLEVYASPGINAKTDKPWREHEDSKDIFIRRNAMGKVQTFIRCSNLKNVPRPPCTHHFNFPAHMKIRVYLSYNRHLLPKWREYEENTIELINSFRVNNPTGESARGK